MKKVIIGLLLLVVLAGTAACAGPASKEVVYSGAIPAPAAPEVRHQYGMSESLGVPDIFLDLDTDESIPAPVIEMPPMPVPTSKPAPTIVPVPARDIEQEFSDGRMIIRTGDMSLVVEDVAAAMEQIAALADSYDGYVVNSNSWQEGERMMGNIAIRVASEYFDAAVRTLRGMAVEVRQESTSGRDVTEEYIDLEARLENLENTRVQLEKLLEKTEEEVSDILEVSRELSRVTGEIEQAKGRMKYLEESSSTSLIQIYLEHSKLTVEFNASTRSLEEGENLRFYPVISGGFAPYSYEWDFSDGETATDEQPLHDYRSDGTYTVTLIVTDDRGNTDTYEREDYVTVLPGWDAGRVAGNIWNGLVIFGRVLVNILIGIAIFSPVWIVILVILYFAWWRRRKKRAEKKAD